MTLYKLLFSLLITSHLFAQNINDKQWNVICNGGEIMSTPNIQIAWVLGEMMVEEYSSNNNSISQGFLQEYARLVPVFNLQATANIKVSPNPFLDILKINIDSDQTFTAFLSNYMGIQIRGPVIINKLHELNLNNLAPGVYLLYFYDNNRMLQKSIRIQKYL